MDILFVKELLDRTSINSFFENAGESIPLGFDKFFMRCNGGRPSPNNIFVDGKERIINNFLSFNEFDKENVYKVRKILLNENPSLLAFARDPAGNFYCLLKEKVVLYKHESGEEELIAETFESFIKLLENGK